MIAHLTEEYTILSDKFEAFRTDNSFPSRINTNDASVPSAFKDYKYPVTAWPVLINKEMADELKEMSLKIPRLLQKIPALYFEDDIKKIADFYFEGNEMQAEFAMMCHSKNLEIGCRLDLTYTQDGFKILEVNVGSSLGGWQIQNFETVIRRNHRELSDRNKKDNYKGKNTLELYMKFLVEQIIKSVGSKNKTLNLFVDMRDVEDEFEKKESVEFFDVFFRQELDKQGLKGKAITGNMDSIELIEGNLCLGDKIIHGIIILTMDANVTPAVFRAFMMDKVYLPDHIGLSMLGDKRNLSLLLELAQKGKFSPEENELILKCIPWTSFVENKKTIFKDKENELTELLKNNKEQFVIKASRGYCKNQ